MIKEFALSGGSTERQPDSVVGISYWHLPNGGDVVNATAVTVFFSDREVAQRLEQKYRNSPEMAVLFELKEITK